MTQYLRKLTEMQYERTPYDLARGTFRVRGDVLELWPAYEDDAVRIEFFGDEIDKITRIDPITGRTSGREYDRLAIYPRTHYVTPRERLMVAMENIRVELDERVAELRANDRLLEAQRLSQRTMFDLEMIAELGYCNGIENYSRHLSGRAAGRAAADADRLLSEGLSARHRRVAPDHSAGARDVGRRPRAQGDAGRIRLPPAERDRQPAAVVRRVRREARRRSSTSPRRPARTSWKRPADCSRSRSSVRRACSIRRSSSGRSRVRSTI